MRTASSTGDAPTMRFPLVTKSYKHLTGISQEVTKFGEIPFQTLRVLRAFVVKVPILIVAGQLFTLTASIRRGYEEED